MRYDVGRFRRPMRRSTEGQLMSLISLGDGSTLSLDFTTGVLDPRLTFTRDGGGTYTGNDGLVYGMDFATSSSLAIGTGSKSVTLTATANVDRRYLIGQTVWISNGANNMRGPVTAYNASTQVLTINATATSGSGSFTSWTVGNASARFDYDPTTLAPRGLLIEGSAVNLATYSDCSTTGWAGLNATGTNNNATSPDNTTTATLWTGGGGGVNRAYSATFSVTSGTTYTISAYVKKPSSNAARYAKIDVKSAIEATIGWPTNGVLDLDTGIASGTGYTVTPMQNGWYRIVSTGTVNSTTTARIFLRITDAAGAEITSTNALLWWGAQAETGSGASSLIPTGASQGSRARDEVVLSNLSGISFNQSAGTVYSQLEIVEKLRGSFIPYGSFDTSGNGRCWWWLRHNHDTSVGQRILGTAFNSGGSTAITSSNYTHSSGVFKFATSLDSIAGRMVYAIAGGPAQVTNASGFTLATAAQMSLNKNNDVAATDLGSMWVRTIKYWPTALPDAQLQSLTT